MSVSSEVCFLVGLGENMSGSVVECVGSFVKYVGVHQVSLFHVFSELDEI